MSNTGTTFRRLQIGGWRQFQAIDIEFHDRLTVLTGTNGAGKTSLLNILSRHLGVERNYLAVRIGGRVDLGFTTSFFSLAKRFFEWFPFVDPSRKSDEPFHRCGTLVYENGVTAALSVPKRSGLQYSLNFQDQQPVVGFHFPSHRPMPIYQEVSQIDFRGIAPSQAFHMLVGPNNASYMGNHHGNSVLFYLKTVLASWAQIGNGGVDPDPAQAEAYNGFIRALAKILPKEIGFKNLTIRRPDIVLETDTGEFMVDASSGGLTTLIEIAALIYTCSLRDDVKGGRFVVTFDEPENHLHPSLQRSLLPTLVEAFPQVQFIIATHSPFMVSSLKDSNVYVLRYANAEAAAGIPSAISAKRRIESEKLDHANRAGTASEILRDVLGVPVTFPAWVEQDLEAIVSRYEKEPVTNEILDQLKSDVKQAGLDDLFPDAMLRLGRRHDRHN